MYLTIVYRANTCRSFLLFLFRRALIVGGHRFVYVNIQRARRRRHVTERGGNPFYIVVDAEEHTANWGFCGSRRLFIHAYEYRVSRARNQNIAKIHVHVFDDLPQWRILNSLTTRQNSIRSSIRKSDGCEANSSISRGAEQTASSSSRSLWIISHSFHTCRRSVRSSADRAGFSSRTEIKLMPIAKKQFFLQFRVRTMRSPPSPPKFVMRRKCDTVAFVEYPINARIVRRPAIEMGATSEPFLFPRDTEMFVPRTCITYVEA